jgi:integrase
VGKRNYAMFLLASRLGLRVSDIVNLKLENIDWENNLIKLEQQKTKRLIELPLLVDVGEAIINYLQDGRRSSAHKEIFLAMTPPYGNITGMTLTSTVQRLILDAGIDTSNRKFGPHAMRHSLASQLLQKEVSLPVISETLGHSTTRATMNYLRIDIKNLTKCLLDAPLVSEAFYNQKGGIFYEYEI